MNCILEVVAASGAAIIRTAWSILQLVYTYNLKITGFYAHICCNALGPISSYFKWIFTFEHPGDYWTCISAIAAIAIALIALIQLGKANKISKVDFIHRFTHAFFNSTNRRLIMLFDKNLLEFKEPDRDKNNERFVINTGRLGEVGLNQEEISSLIKRQIYSSNEVDDTLEWFEDIGSYEEKGFIDIQMIYSVFSWYIETAWDNKAVNDYIKWQRKEKKGYDDIYKEFENIYIKCKSFRSPKERPANEADDTVK